MHPIAVALTAVVILASPPNVQVDDGGSAGRGGETPGRTTTRYHDGKLTVEASTPGSLRLTRTPGSRSSGAVIRCGYYDIDVASFDTFDLYPTVPYRRQELFLLACWYPTGNPRDPSINAVRSFPRLVHWTGRAPPGLVTDAEVARYAANSIVFAPPTPVLSPATNQVVGVPTWLAVTSKLNYAPVSAQAGNVWATVRPRFSHATWRFGNGETATCIADVATTWKQRLSADVQSSDCTYTFEGNGDGEPLVGSVSITWRVRFTSRETGPRGEALAPITLTRPVVFNVRELQAVID